MRGKGTKVESPGTVPVTGGSLPRAPCSSDQSEALGSADDSGLWGPAFLDSRKWKKKKKLTPGKQELKRKGKPASVHLAQFRCLRALGVKGGVGGSPGGRTVSGGTQTLGSPP